MLFKEKSELLLRVVFSHIQRIGCQPEKIYFTRWPIPLVSVEQRKKENDNITDGEWYILVKV